MILLIGNHKNITMEPKVRFASLRAPELIDPNETDIKEAG